MDFWPYIGVALLAWVAFDIWAGHTYLHRRISRQKEPVLFWSLAGLWIVVAVFFFL